MMATKSNIILEKLTQADWQWVKAIYKEGIVTKNATFETEVPVWSDWDNQHLKDCRFVARKNGKILGWAALSPVSDRCIYNGVAEVSVYISKTARGKGLGKLLLHELIEKSENINIWTLQAGIFPENQVSIGLHINLGFREVGFREKIGKLDGVWRDVVLLERRSQYM
jgi:phosphinothricin acetyltransferase